MYKDLEGKVALITGATGGIGKPTAIVFAKNKVNLIICDVDMEKLESTAAELRKYGIDVLPVKMDVSKSDDVERGVKEGIKRFKHIDILLNCAGICIASKIVDLSEDVWDLIMDVNLKGIFMLSKTVAKNMIENKIKGKIISIASQASKLGEYGNGAYSCSKAGINTLTQVLAQELAEYGITATSICPGYVDTEMMQDVFKKRGPLEGMTPKEYEQKLCSRVPLGRMAKPEEIGEFLAFLASEKANYITGVALTIAGGSTLI